MPDEPAGTSGNAPDADPLLAAEAAGEDEPGPSGSVEAWPAEETAISAEEEKRLLKVCMSSSMYSCGATVAHLVETPHVMRVICWCHAGVLPGSAGGVQG